MAIIQTFHPPEVLQRIGLIRLFKVSVLRNNLCALGLGYMRPVFWIVRNVLCRDKKAEFPRAFRQCVVFAKLTNEFSSVFAVANNRPVLRGV